jgi:hypothetical protein
MSLASQDQQDLAAFLQVLTGNVQAQRLAALPS